MSLRLRLRLQWANLILEPVDGEVGVLRQLKLCQSLGRTFRLLCFVCVCLSSVYDQLWHLVRLHFALTPLTPLKLNSRSEAINHSPNKTATTNTMNGEWNGDGAWPFVMESNAIHQINASDAPIDKLILRINKYKLNQLHLNDWMNHERLNQCV